MWPRHHFLSQQFTPGSDVGYCCRKGKTWSWRTEEPTGTQKQLPEITFCWLRSSHLFYRLDVHLNRWKTMQRWTSSWKRSRTPDVNLCNAEYRSNTHSLELKHLARVRQQQLVVHAWAIGNQFRANEKVSVEWLTIEDEILHLLSASEGDVLEDDTLVKCSKMKKIACLSHMDSVAHHEDGPRLTKWLLRSKFLWRLVRSRRC